MTLSEISIHFYFKANETLTGETVVCLPSKDCRDYLWEKKILYQLGLFDQLGLIYNFTRTY